MLEANTLRFGTTSGTTAHLNTLLDTPYNQIAKDFGEKNAQLAASAAKDALSLIRENISTYNINCGHQQQVAYLFSQNEQQDKELEEIMQATANAGVPIEYVNEFPVPIPFTKTFKAGEQGKFHPIEYIFALAEQFEELGSVIMQHCRVTNWKEDEFISVDTTCVIIEGR